MYCSFKNLLAIALVINMVTLTGLWLCNPICTTGDALYILKPFYEIQH